MLKSWDGFLWQCRSVPYSANAFTFSLRVGVGKS
jgi:hypothetical protein